MNGIDGAGFPVRAGILFGLGLAGFFDYLLHQILQWQHVLTDPLHQEKRPAFTSSNLSETCG